MITTQYDNVVSDWTNANKEYRYETRACIPMNPFVIQQGSLKNEWIFSIDVKGFYRDEACTDPIDLYERKVITIDESQTDKQTLDQLRKDLDQFTAKAYDNFAQTLATEKAKGKVFTSDPLHMKI